MTHPIDAFRSPLARQAAVRDPRDAPRRGVPWGFLIHTTGGGVTDLAKKRGERPIDVALRVYVGAQNGDNGYLWGGPHYVCEHDGTIHQIAPDDAMTAHAGGYNRGRYFDGSWAPVFPEATARWRKQWPAYAHPYELFPSTSPNHDYIGLEMIPCGDGFGRPMRAGLRFTQEQHDVAIRLAHDRARAHAWPAGWQRTSRLLGHEDVDPLNRADRGGGWDPGFLRAAPFFDFEYVRRAVEAPAT